MLRFVHKQEIDACIPDAWYYACAISYPVRFLAFRFVYQGNKPFSVVFVHPFLVMYLVCMYAFFFFFVQVVIDDAQFLDKDSWTLALAVATGELKDRNVNH